ncbi:LADA_0B01156g1_1 [Lachancea dasiensis]|uniref:LADA_0B01156g1_1 n=1 Tax=Lachancea dasiensis TaxID=1072105 RepID=A0A1G4ISA6_9SACH|nr:LADA_0B01156g1_1 [Lachancea dasiensis]
MGGILKNPLPDHNGRSEESESISEFRKQVFKNTQLNAQLSSNSHSEDGHPVLSPRKHSIPKDTLSLKHEQDTLSKAEEQERLKWNQQNLDDNDLAKLQYQDISIDEPKTPYQGAVDPTGEYYREDDDEELGSLSLGDPVVKLNKDQNQAGLEQGQSQGEQQEQQWHSDSPDEELDTEPESQEDRHKRFEALRKQHYNVKQALDAQKDASLHDEEDEDN